MPKNSSKSDTSISPEQFLLKKNVVKKMGLLVCLLCLSFAVVFLLNKKTSSIVTALPSGPMAYFRLDRPAEHVRAFRQSKFWQDLSKIDATKYLASQGMDTKEIKEYESFQRSVNEFLNSPLFQQFFSKEAAVAIYPPQQGFSNADWPYALSGLVMVVRPEVNTRLLESIGKLFNQHNQKMISTQKSYNQVTITSVSLKNSGVTIFYIRLKDFLIVSVDERWLHRVIDSAKSQKNLLSQDQRFLPVAQGFYNHSSGEEYLNVPEIRNALKTFLQAPSVAGMTHSASADAELYLSQFDGLDVMGGSFILAQNHRHKWTVMFDPAKANLFKRQSMDRCVTINNSSLNLIPKEAVIYQWSSCIDFPALYQQMQDRIQHSSRSPAKLPPTLEFLQATWGLSFEKDVLPVLGGEMGWFVQGVEVDGLFPVPKITFIFKIKDEGAAKEILRKVSTTPITRVQNEEYRNFTISYVTIPLIETFKPSYAFIDGNLFIASSDEIIKKIIDVKQNPQMGLATQEVFKQGLEGRLGTDHAIFFMNIKEISKQGLQLVEWDEKKYNQRLKQALDSENSVTQTLQAEEAQIKADSQRLEYAQVRLNSLNGEIKSLEAQVQASAVVMESENTLAQEGRLRKSADQDEAHPSKVLSVKKSQAAALELEAKGFEHDLELAQSRKLELKRTQENILKLKGESEKYRYQVHEVIIPVLNALQSIAIQRTTTRFKEGFIDSEMFLTVQ